MAVGRESAEGQCVLVITNRLGMLSVSAALALRQAGFRPEVALMRAAAGRRGSVRDTIANYGLAYTIERIADAALRVSWLILARREWRQLEVHEVSAGDWDGLGRLADRKRAAALVSASFAYRFPPHVIGRHKLLLNLHPAPLPDWRGADPIYWMLRRRETVFGVTLHAVAENFDEGDVFFSALAQPRFRFSRGLVELCLSRVARSHLGDWMSAIIRGDVVPRSQGTGTYWPLPTKRNQCELL
ncbi:MAG: formyltransferase family protein [Sinimarinibacterium flocculans]|uniref:formyltransferase family protein n=1 Tax=Sinimarinibacterium flocculans TaxID=985250 RepID=UPI003C316350